MAEDCVNQAATLAGLDEREAVTRSLNIHGFHHNAERFGALAGTGADAPGIEQLAQADRALAERLHPALPVPGSGSRVGGAKAVARSIEDVLARRMRALFLNARAALEMAPRVAALMAGELGRDERWQAAQLDRFRSVASGSLTFVNRPG